MRTMAVALLASTGLLAACDGQAPAPTPEETTMAVDGEEVTIDAPPMAEASDASGPAPAPGDPETPETEPTLMNPNRVPSGDVAEDRAALTAIPARFLGQWDAVDGSCESGSEMLLTIRPGTISFYESQGEVTAVRRGRPGIVVTLAMQGEGESWSSEYAMSLARGGEQLATRTLSGPEGGSDGGNTRRRCPPAAGGPSADMPEVSSPTP